MTSAQYIREHLFVWAGRPQALLELSELVDLLANKKGPIAQAKKPQAKPQGRPAGSGKKYIKTVVNQKKETPVVEKKEEKSLQ